jgi:hypothetical protein
MSYSYLNVGRAFRDFLKEKGIDSVLGVLGGKVTLKTVDHYYVTIDDGIVGVTIHRPKWGEIEIASVAIANPNSFEIVLKAIKKSRRVKWHFIWYMLGTSAIALAFVIIWFKFFN